MQRVDGKGCILTVYPIWTLLVLSCVLHLMPINSLPTWEKVQRGCFVG